MSIILPEGFFGLLAFRNIAVDPYDADDFA